jgi:hypothetical protein
MENGQTPDPYEAVLADLRAQRDRIDSTITLLEGLRSGAPATSSRPAGGGTGSPDEKGGNRPDLGPGAFLGLSIPEAAKKLLATKRQQMRTADIVAELERGGLVLTSADKVNTVGSVLLRRFQTTGDLVRVARGLWGLQEWYPGRRFPGGKGKPDEAAKGGDEEQEKSPAGNVTDTQPVTAGPTGAPAPWQDRPVRVDPEE